MQLEQIKSFIEKRPKVEGAYGYGSGIFRQSGYTKRDRPQIDLILVVDDLKEWHKENMMRNPHDYSFIGKLFFKHASIDRIKGCTGIVYFSNIIENGLVYKYGTIEESDLLIHLEKWDSFYVPGRFQKKILTVVEDPVITRSNEENRKNVLCTALLTLPVDKNRLIDVYTQICGLSYLGDTRMKFAENPRKVLNIVEGSYDSFEEIYPLANPYCVLNDDGTISIDRVNLLDAIPNLPDSLVEYIRDTISDGDLIVIKNKILEYFTNINKKESIRQTLKGICTNGVVRSIKYASKKIMKKVKK